MALERESIEKKEFPIAGRGYDPAAVDSHLSAIADEVEELKRSAGVRTETLASAASKQVRSIVEAAEQSAAEIRRQADEEARKTRAEASSEAQLTREQAASQAREHVRSVSESTAVMLERLDSVERELGPLVDSLRTAASRLNADLHLLQGNLTDVREVAAAGTRSGVEPPAEESADRARPSAERAPVAATAASHEQPGGSDDTEGARLIALSMALDGTPREETDRYLADNFQLTDRPKLLDEVYANVEG